MLLNDYQCDTDKTATSGTKLHPCEQQSRAQSRCPLVHLDVFYILCSFTCALLTGALGQNIFPITWHYTLQRIIFNSALPCPVLPLSKFIAASAAYSYVWPTIHSFINVLHAHCLTFPFVHPCPNPIFFF